jgi:amino acid permease
MFSYPLQIHPCRASVDAVLKWRPNRSSNSTPQRIPLRGGPSRKPDLPMGDMRFALLTTFLIITTYIVAISVTSLESVLAYVGSTGSTSISFILPGLFYWKISAPDSPYHQALRAEDDDERSDTEDDDVEPSTSTGIGAIRMIRRSAKWKRGLLRKLSLALSIWGVIVMVACLAVNIFLV